MYDDYHFDRDAEDALHEAYLMAIERCYTDEQMRALREILLDETRFSNDALRE